MDKLFLNRQLEPVTDPTQAVLVEKTKSNHVVLGIFDLLLREGVARSNVDRFNREEDRIDHNYETEHFTLLDWFFDANGIENFIFTLEGGGQILVYGGVFKKDAERVLSFLYANRKPLSQLGAINIRVGMASFDPPELSHGLLEHNEVAFFRGRYGGLTTLGVSDALGKATLRPLFLHPFLPLAARGKQAAEAVKQMASQVAKLSEAKIILKRGFGPRRGIRVTRACDYPEAYALLLAQRRKRHTSGET